MENNKETELIKKFYREPIFDYSENKIKVQTLEWDITHDSRNKLIVRAFGVTEKSESIVINITNFNPFFYIKVPEYFTDSYIPLILDHLKSKLPRNLKNGIVYDSCSIISSKSFFGYSETPNRFLKLVFSSDLTKKECQKRLNYQIFLGRKRIKFELFETKIESILRFFHVTGIQPSGILTVENFDLVETRNAFTQLEIKTNIFNILKFDSETRFKILQVSFDIETYSIDDTFPKPTIPENVITHIGTKWTWSNEQKSHLSYLVSLNSDKIKDSDIIHFIFDSEKKLLENFIENFRKLDPDIIYHYNGDSFDWNFIAVRCQKYNLDLNISKIKFEPALIKKTSFSSSAYGTTRYNRLIIPGRVNFDILIFMQREFKENSYKLNDICMKYLGKEKDPITVSDIFNSYRDSNKDLSKKVGFYCLQDSLLPQLLVDHFYILENQIGMSNVTFVPFTFLFTQGQEIKAFSQILNKTLSKGYIVPDFFETKTDEKFTGATVMTPETGGYFDYPVAVLDFEGLYPSIMMAHNLCYSSYIKDNVNVNFECEIKKFEWTDTHGSHSYLFAQNTDSVLPELLLELKTSRNVAKKLKKESTGILKVIYDKRQLAYKVSMNSIYGFLSAFKMHCKPIGATVTFIGREMIKDTASAVIKHYPKSTVIYGDSVAEGTPVLVKIDDIIHILSINELGNGYNWKNCTDSDKEYIELKDVFSWTETGWTKCHRVIRHKLCSSKQMTRILTHSGLVDVTDDHSLLKNNGETISPKKLKVGDSLLHNKPLENKIDLNLFSEEESQIMGFFFGDGSCGIYGQKSSWALNNSDMSLLLIYKNLCEKVYPDYEWTILDTIKSSHVYKLVPKKKKLKLKDFINNYRTLMYKNDAKIIPVGILNGSMNIREKFSKGLYDSDGDKNCSRIDQKNQISCAMLYYLYCSLGNNVSVNDRHDKLDIFRITFSKNKGRKDPCKVKKISILEKKSEYVYDLTTENNHFQAGIGSIIVHNTDSVFVNFKENKENTEKLGKEAAKLISKIFKNPINLEYEKFYFPFIMLSKKRYLGIKYENGPNGKMDSKGLVINRRDSSDLLKKVYNGIIDLLMNFKKEEAIGYITEQIKSLRNGQFDLNDLQITKTYKRTDYVNQNLPHIVIAKRMESRGQSVNINDRINYLFIENGSKKNDPQYKRIEEFQFALENGIKPDIEYYIDKQLKNSIIDILSAVIGVDAAKGVFGEKAKVVKPKKDFFK